LDVNGRFGVLSHGIQADPIYNYGNQAALTLFGHTIESLCRTPSRRSTLPTLEQNRATIIADIEKSDYGYFHNALRCSTSGKIWVMSEILYWKVYNDEGKHIGAAAFYDVSRCLPAKFEDDRGPLESDVE